MWEGGVEPDTELKIFFFPPSCLELAKKSMETTHFVP